MSHYPPPSTALPRLGRGVRWSQIVKEIAEDAAKAKADVPASPPPAPVVKVSPAGDVIRIQPEPEENPRTSPWFLRWAC